MTPIFNRHGHTIAWLKDTVVYALSGKQELAFLSGNNLFTYSKQYLGTLQNGYFRDKNGNAVAFIKGASNGPLLPITKIPPIPPIPKIPRISPIPPIPPIAKIPTLSWSNIDWEPFINGYL